MRKGEILMLKWEHVNLVERRIRLQAEDTKETDNKTIGIEQDLYDILIEVQTYGVENANPRTIFFSHQKAVKSDGIISFINSDGIL
jgi:integrase